MGNLAKIHAFLRNLVMLLVLDFLKNFRKFQYQNFLKARAVPKVVQLGGAEEVYAKWLDCPRKIRNLISPETLQMAFPRRFLSIKLELAKPNSLKIKALPRETSLLCRVTLHICRLTLPRACRKHESNRFHLAIKR